MVNSWDELETLRGEWVAGEWPTIPETFHISVHRFPDRACFTTFAPTHITYTYKEVETFIEIVADYLITQDMQQGDPVILTGKNTPWWGIAYLAILEAGGVVVPIDYQLENETVERLMAFSGAKLAFIDREKYQLLDPEGKFLTAKIGLAPGEENFILDLKARHRRKFTPKEHDLAAILFTSGTTGNEKGVMLTHKNFMSDVYQACHDMFISATHEDVWYALLPLHHSYCMTAVFLEGIKHGSEIVFTPRLAVPQIMKDLKQGQITMFMGIPLLFNKILQGMMRQVRAKGLAVHIFVGTLMRISGLIKKLTGKNLGKKFFASLLKKANLYSVRIFISGGGPLAPETFRRYNQLGLDFVQGYGLTETSPIITLNPVAKFKVHSVGKVFPLVDMKILNPDEHGIGEVIVKGPNITQGYFKNPAATEELFNEEGYLLTGDVGYLDKDNYLYLTGRKKSLIVTEGGKNVFPEEIEDHFQLDQPIEQILIRGYLANKATRAEGIEAVIYPNKDHFESLGILNIDKIQEILVHTVKEHNKELLPYKRIQRIRIIDTPLEMTTTKKIKRAKVHEWLEAEAPGTIFEL